jgi:hypothetical protein
MEHLQREIEAYRQAMDLIEDKLGQPFFSTLNLSAKDMILKTLQQAFLKTAQNDLPQGGGSVSVMAQNRMEKLGHGLSGATRAWPLLLKGFSNPLRVRVGNVVAMRRV